MTEAWLIGAPLAVGYALLMIRGSTFLVRIWERRHPH
jgi:hypothetical protein